MKIKVKEATYEEVLKKKPNRHKLPLSSMAFLRAIVKIYAKKELKKVNFTATIDDDTKYNEPCLYLMNHSSFTDLLIAFHLIPHRFSTVCTDDGFIGKEWLLRHLGCIPTMKFITDPTLVRDMLFVKKILHQSILMYPEASYSFDGTATTLPESLGKLAKLLKMPVVMIKTDGSFLRDPLYNNLQIRNVDVKAKVSLIASKDEVLSLESSVIEQRIKDAFTFDNFATQMKEGILIKEPFRADSLNRVLFRCPLCNQEGMMEGKGITLTCHNCHTVYTMQENGQMTTDNPQFTLHHIPDWFKYEREIIRQEILDGVYHEEFDCEIYILKNLKAIYHIGSGHLTHSTEGFHLVGASGKLDYWHKAIYSYSLYSDFYWYELGDIVCIGDDKMRYYCIPKNRKDIVSRLRLAAEEIFKLIAKK